MKLFHAGRTSLIVVVSVIRELCYNESIDEGRAIGILLPHVWNASAAVRSIAGGRSELSVMMTGVRVWIDQIE